MWKIALLLLVLLPVPAESAPFRTAEHGAVLLRTQGALVPVCDLQHYNICSGWVWYWTGFCGRPFQENLPVKYGVAFDLDDCTNVCESVVDVWWAVKAFSSYGLVDVEIYEARQSSVCPMGPPLLGIYSYVPSQASPWQQFDFSPFHYCLGFRPNWFIVLITDHTAGIHTAPYSDCVPENVAAGCQDWRCAGHSFIYVSRTDYCTWYGLPTPLWVTAPEYGCANEPDPPLPPNCAQSSYPTGVWSEFLIDVNLECLGPTELEETSWSGVKAMYR